MDFGSDLYALAESSTDELLSSWKATIFGSDGPTEFFGPLGGCKRVRGLLKNPKQGKVFFFVFFLSVVVKLIEGLDDPFFLTFTI